MPTCTPAEETGRVRKPMTEAERLAFRKRVEAKTDAEWEQQRKEREAARAKRIRDEAMGERFSKRTFDTFDIAGRSKDVIDAYQMCKEFAGAAYERLTETGKFKGERVSIMMTGSYGTGKTHLAAAIANRFLDAGKPVCFATWEGHLKALQKEFGTESKRYFEWMATAPLLVIDDITEMSDSRWAQATLLEAVNRRYEDMLPVVVTTNLSGARLRELNPRLYDRLKEMATILDMQDESYRDRIGRH